MKVFFLAAFIFLTVKNSVSQDFPGFRTGNYTGVNGVFFNPANIADSRYRFDFNLFSANTLVGNNQASFNFKTLGNSFESDELSNQIFKSDAGATSAMINFSLHGPSLMFNAGKKSSIAITTRARTMANVFDMDGQLLKQLSDDLNFDTQLPYTISSKENMRMVVNSWTEFGLSFGREIADKGKNYLKGGVSVKYLSGVGNGFISIDNFNGTLNEDALGDVYFANTTGRISTGFGGFELSNFEFSNFKNMQSTGLGTDIGFVYEFRPNYEDYKLDTSAWMKDRNKYKIKVGVALLDIGSIKYKKDQQRSGSYNIDVTGGERLYVEEFSDLDIDDYNNFFKSRPQYFTPEGTNAAANYSVSLPTTLNEEFDYHLRGNLYANVGAMIPLTGEKEYNSRFYTNFSLTPRYEGRQFGIYLPVNYNSLTNFNAGLSMRLGPLFFGSGSVISALLGDSKQADVFVGLRFGGLHKITETKEMRRIKRETEKQKAVKEG